MKRPVDPDHDGRYLVFSHALALAVQDADEGEGSAELVALARGDLAALEAARVRCLEVLEEGGHDQQVRTALDLLTSAQARARSTRD
jgi:hypothetical protein